MNEKNKNKPFLDSGVAKSISKVWDSGLLNYRSEALPTWCPGCGYYGITIGITKALNKLHIDNKKFVVVSGIGCAGRYPFFANGYGFHGVHGRALPIACGVKIANPELTVLAVGGDGDGLGIGSGHLPHSIRRNVDITYVLFNNGIYGLTKGQTSPTTPTGQVTGTHPYGNPDTPLNPIMMALSYGATFVAQGWAANQENLTNILIEAFKHKGFSFVLVVTPCVTFDHTNIMYDKLRDMWEPLPENYSSTDFRQAMLYAMEKKYYEGIFYRNQSPTFEDRQKETIKRAMMGTFDTVKQ